MNTPPALIADRYRLVQLIGSGGMGVVWQAWDERLERTVALKMLRTRPELTDDERELATKRALREARISAGLHHPHAVPVFDVTEHDGQPCIVMQLIESTPLSTLLREHGEFTPAQTSRVGAEVGSALAAAHRRRIVHRDVKPGNILIREDGSAMISDFGIAQALGDTTITATGLVHGTPAYLAPEVARGEPSTFASDVFSLGSTLYAMVEGVPPFGVDQNAIALLHRVASGEAPVPEHAGPLAPVLRQMLSPDPRQRPDMATVTRRLAELAERAGAADAAGRASDVEPEPATAPLIGTAAAAAAGAAVARDAAITASAGPPTLPAETKVIGETAATERLADAPAAAVTPADSPARAEPLFPWMAETPPVARAEAAAPERASTTESEPPPSPPAGTGDGERRRRRTAVVVGAVVAVALLVVGGILLAGGLLPGDGGTAEPEARSTPTAGADPTPTETAPPESSAAPEPTPEPTPAPPAEESLTAEERAAQMLVDYYGLVPGDLDTAWNLMTADYQVNHVGGRDAYQAFWGEVSDVEISDVAVSAPDQAQATLTYTFSDGRVVQEITAYQLVDEGGTLKIAGTTVLSSIQL